MADFMMIMKGPGKNGDWATYINQLAESGNFRGGSVLANGQCISKGKTTNLCSVTGFMKFEADNIEQVLKLVEGNPDYESGGEVEVLEVVLS